MACCEAWSRPGTGSAESIPSRSPRIQTCPAGSPPAGFPYRAGHNVLPHERVTLARVDTRYDRVTVVNDRQRVFYS
jgi:hypothetical protein